MSTWLNVLDYNKSLSNGLAEGGYTGAGIPVVMGGTGQTTASAAFNALSPMTTGGDLIYGGASGAGARLANGTAGQVLTSAGTTAAPTWTNPSGSGVTSVAQTVPSFLSIAGSPITTTGTLAISYSGTALPLANGGTALTSHVTAATASTFTSWDANKNLTANNFLASLTATASSGTTLALVVGSAQQQQITGTVAQTISLPQTSTLVAGQSFEVFNSSTQQATVNTFSAIGLDLIPAGGAASFTCLSTASDAAASWFVSLITTISSVASIAQGGTGHSAIVTAPTASTIPAWDANANLSANNVLRGYQAITSSATLVTLTVSSPYISNVTGTAAQIVQLPVASTLVLGQSFQVLNNNSTGNVTVNSSGSNAVGIIVPGTKLNFMCVLTSGTTAASWIVL
jgi:hypothetical protein